MDNNTPVNSARGFNPIQSPPFKNVWVCNQCGAFALGPHGNAHDITTAGLEHQTTYGHTVKVLLLEDNEK